MPTPHHPSAAVRKALGKLGSDLRDARRRRRLPMAVLADRAFTSRATLQRVEAGDPAVSMGIYAAVMHSLETGGQATFPFNFKKDFSTRYSHILAKPRFAKSAKSSSHLCITYFGLNDLLKQEPQARRRPRRLIENTILKNDESVQDANEDLGAPTS